MNESEGKSNYLVQSFSEPVCETHSAHVARQRDRVPHTTLAVLGDYVRHAQHGAFEVHCFVQHALQKNLVVVLVDNKHKHPAARNGASHLDCGAYGRVGRVRRRVGGWAMG